MFLTFFKGHQNVMMKWVQTVFWIPVWSLSGAYMAHKQNHTNHARRRRRFMCARCIHICLCICICVFKRASNGDASNEPQKCEPWVSALAHSRRIPDLSAKGLDWLSCSLLLAHRPAHSLCVDFPRSRGSIGLGSQPIYICICVIHKYGPHKLDPRIKFWELHGS